MKIPILMYHMVCEANHPNETRYCCSPKKFRKQMAYLKRAGYQVISLDELVNSIRSTNQTNQQIQLTKPHKAVVLTFDDGFADNYDNAFPVLKEYVFPATVFVVSRFVGRTNEWMHKNGFPRRELLGWRELKEMSQNGITVGSHTTTHASLTDIDSESAMYEIASSKIELETALKKPVRFFAYPYGLFNKQTENAVVEAGYCAACSTRSGFNSELSNPHVLRRIEVYGTDPLWKFILKLQFGTNEATLTLPLRYYFSRIIDRLSMSIPKP